MFYRVVTSVVFTLALSFLSSPAFAILPACVSPSSDSDGDGYGWENDQSCEVRAANQRPACRYTDSDPDGDGWGWENNTSCLITEASFPTCTSAEFDPDGDGWGWENNRSCRVSDTEVTTPIVSDLPEDVPVLDELPDDELPSEDEIPSEEVASDVQPVDGDLAADSIIGAWHSECVASGNDYIRTILAIDEDIIAQDVHQYTDSNCSGVPVGLSFPVRIYAYTLGNEVALGQAAWEIDTQVTQISQSAVFRDGVATGQQRFGLIGFDQNRLHFSPGSLSIENRSDSFGSTSFSPKPSLSAAIEGVGDFAGLYESGCILRDDTGSTLQQITVTGATANTTDFLFLNDFCAGPSDVELLQRTAFVPEPNPFTTFFGDYALNVFTSRDEQEIVSGADLLEEEFDVLAARDRYTLFALANNDTLMRGDCVVRESTCKTAPEYFADMIDFEFNPSLRFRQVDSFSHPLQGSSDSSAVAGLWDFSSPEDNFFAYQRFDANGQGVFYQLERGTVDSPDACLSAFPETITVYPGGIYEQEYDPDNPDNGYVIFSSYVIEGGVLVSEDPRLETRFEYPALDALPALPECV